MPRHAISPLHRFEVRSPSHDLAALPATGNGQRFDHSDRMPVPAMTSRRHLALDNAVARWAHWPHKTTSPYFPKFYGALQPHGVVPVTTMGNKVGWLATEQADVLHFHWPDSFWRRDFGRYLGRVKGIWNAREYLRTAKRAGLKIVWTVHNHDAHEGERSQNLGHSPYENKVNLRLGF